MLIPIPSYYSLHWSLIVLCHPGEVAAFQGTVAFTVEVLKVQSNSFFRLILTFFYMQMMH